MRQYKGYYIDKVIFNNEDEIDEFIKSEAIRAYKQSVELFVNQSTMGNSIYCDDKAEILVNQFGFTWEQIEELEIQVMKSVA